MGQSAQRTYGIPVAVLIAGVLIAGAVFASRGTDTRTPGATNDRQVAEDVRTPDTTDHIRGNPNTAIAIIEFSDFECPFCARIHPTLRRIVAQNEDVKWVYRHFPLTSIHSRALSAAVASECIARLGTNDDFWAFADAVYENQRALDATWYAQQATMRGIDATAFDACLTDKSIVTEIQADIREVTAHGGRGTPYVIVISDTHAIPFSGALPYEQILGIIERVRQN